MSDSSGLAAIQYQAALSILARANRQPENALQLILQSTAPPPATTAGQSVPTVQPVQQGLAVQVSTPPPVQPAPSVDGSGQFIDIIV